ncbi:MAG: sulfatase-like hydrolase/transferase [Armatimonadia bacterium]|nr:sulfatase-like hydrolase/transferase [Armatimonadia bacterium]
MDRRQFLSAAGAVAASAAVSARGDDGTLAQRPNIVLIMADDLGYRELGCFGQDKIRTPNLDRLAAEGMKLERFYSGSPVCAPTRCTLMTGKHTGHAYIRGNKEVGGWGPEEPEGQWPLRAGAVTMAEALGRVGYATGAFGKWGLGGPGSEGHPCEQGFDHFYGYLCQRVAHNYYPTHLWRNHDVDVLHGNDYFPAHQRIDEPLPTEDDYYERFAGEDYAPEEIQKETEAWLRANADGPFFLYMPSIIPHVSLQAPRELIETYPREWDPEPYLGQQGYLPHPRPHAAYAAMITFLDQCVGRTMDLLEELGVADNTLVLFTSDNGTTFNGGCDREFFDSLGELRGTKCTVYEGGIRVPTIARWPGHIQPGSTSRVHGGTWDLLPTLASAAGGLAPPGIDGIDLTPALRGEGVADREYLYFEYPEADQQQAVILDRFKGVRTNLREGDLTVHLYDLDRDPGETMDVAGEHPAVVERIEEIMFEAREPSELFPIPALDEGTS